MKKINGLMSFYCLFAAMTAKAVTVQTAHDFFSAGAQCHTAKEPTVFVVNPQMQLSLANDPHGYCLLSIKYQHVQLSSLPAQPATVNKQQFAADTPYAMVEKSMTGSASHSTTPQPAPTAAEQIATPVTYACPLSEAEVAALTTPEALAAADQFIRDPKQKMDATTAALFSPVLNCIKQYTPPALPMSPLPQGAVPFGAVPVGTPLRLPSGQVVTPQLPGQTPAPTSSNSTVPAVPASTSLNPAAVSH
jgi:hypothetical protein